MAALAGGAALTAGASILPGLTSTAAAASGSVARASQPTHLAWVWQFSEDGEADVIRDVLAAHGLGIILKTHDGARWMSRWDHGEHAVWGPEQVHWLANYFESAGVPFHAWCVVQGKDPSTEAHMCAEVLAAGARSMVIDLEPAEKGQYWQGRPRDAGYFGQELRRLQPYAHVSVAPDPRPWQIDILPVREFAEFSNEFAPQSYWPNFNTRANYRLFKDWGFPVGPAGVTPEMVLDVSAAALGEFGLPIRPIALSSTHPWEVQRFVEHAYTLGMDAVSVWRYGVSHPDVWPLLRDLAPRATEPAAAPVVETQPERIIEPEPQYQTSQAIGIGGETSTAPSALAIQPVTNTGLLRHLPGLFLAAAGAALAFGRYRSAGRRAQALTRLAQFTPRE
jgi:hypothetical protein